ncbi:efflux RND transporter periplasmic adaptor subunit [Novosphingobium beihaiensis]|uniref:Efflux RND transporter periplasmic adaptor subunit n=1 Tax=Novosphingobium beihaiensis TaxID=2930389 RepID=A0ABT0BVV9_9SPHN|nr:efflux RND transporter periplasmic adaptor subunit [Novosphingobium beihaiensis]MCJ2189120.1 efflux RND transporter periplasmic adaptor subunit [Novosphingobium beihaiensis]
MNEDSGSGPSPLDAFLGAHPKRRRRHIAGIVLLAIALLAAVFLAMRFLTGVESPYYFAPAEAGDLTPQVSERGVVRGSRELTIRSRADGTIAQLAVASAGHVERGQELARIDAGALKQLLEADKASLEAAQADLKAMQAVAAQKSEQLARFERVWAKSEGRVPSRNELASARAEAARAAQEQQAAQERLQAARLKLAARRKQMDGTTIRAPFAGFLEAPVVQAGQQVREGSLLFRLTPDNDSLAITVPWANGEPARLKPGTQATVRFDSLPERTWHAKLSRISRDGDGAHAVFVLETPGEDLHPGMEAVLEIALPERHNALLVPDAALQFAPDAPADRSRAQVYLLGEGGTPQRVYVTAGGSDGSRTEIFSGAVKPGDQVIIGMRGASQNRD